MPKSKAKAVVKKVDETEVDVLTADEVKLLDEAVAFINQQANAPAKSLIEIGKYLLEKFFENNPKKADDRAPRKGISLRKLAEHDDISMNHQTLSNAVKLAAQEHLFTDPKYQSLTESHKLLLFRIGKKDKEKIKYADKVVKDNLSVRKLNDVLVGAKLLAARGRPELGSGGSAPDLFASFIRPIEKLANFDLSFDVDTANQLTEKQFDALKALKDRLEKIIALRGKVKK